MLVPNYYLLQILPMNIPLFKKNVCYHTSIKIANFDINKMILLDFYMKNNKYIYIKIIMSILKIARIGHPILTKKAEKLKNISQNALKRIIIDMTHTLIDSNGIGLAAPQVYINKRIILFRSDLNNKEKKEIDEKKIQITALINPSYKGITEEYEDDWEGRLSIPGMIGKVRRFKKITYKGYNLKGKLVQKTVEGIISRVIQHECDHLNGILYISRLSDPKFFGYAEEFKN